jgi:glycosyltransferase involved in cell wall biosynthesis
MLSLLKKDLSLQSGTHKHRAAVQHEIKWSSMQPTVRILGTHGVPAAYGGFETAAENVGLFLVKRGWRVIVYCQIDGTGPITEDIWNGLERVNIPVSQPGWRGTSKFDLISIRHACRHRDVCLTFGYNTGVYNILQRLKRIPNIINMDGIEWSRKRWGLAKQAILYVNERFAALYGNLLIADHPVIETYLRTRAPARKITTITYGAHPFEHADTTTVIALGLQPKKYLTLIARPIPENNVLEIVQAFSARARGVKLVVLGNLSPDDPYHNALRAAASDEVVFPGGIYEPERVQALRFHSLIYMHGHTVGGTNPSLVEALAAGNPVIAHDNPYNRWVAEDAALYFTDVAGIERHIETILADELIAETMKLAAKRRFNEEFTWDRVARQYEQALLRYTQKDVVLSGMDSLEVAR